MEEMYWMIDKLMHREIDGFLLDKYTFWNMGDVLQMNSDNDHHHRDIKNFLLTETIKTDVPHSGNTLSGDISCIQSKLNILDSHFNKNRKMKSCKIRARNLSTKYYIINFILCPFPGGEVSSKNVSNCRAPKGKLISPPFRARFDLDIEHEFHTQNPKQIYRPLRPK